MSSPSASTAPLFTNPSAAPVNVTTTASSSTDTIERNGDMIIGDTPVCLVLGMAGSGKTTLVDALSAYLEDPEGNNDKDDNDMDITDEIDRVEQPFSSLSIDSVNSTMEISTSDSDNDKTNEKTTDPVFVLNLDPAVHDLPYEPNIDIRDTIDYKKVMKDYKLGPNGAIITCLNLYATRFDQVLSILTKRSKTSSTIIIDTPGQIETFTWSASGTIITDSLAQSLPTIILYVVDLPRCNGNPMTFVSNMLYACSIMYKTRLPMVIIFNKMDEKGLDGKDNNVDLVKAWMTDFNEFDKELSKIKDYIGDLARSMAMALQEFYHTLPTVAVSAITGQGMQDVVNAIHECVKTFKSDYVPMLEEKRRQRKEEELEKKNKNLEQFHRDRNQRDGDDNDDIDPALRAWRPPGEDGYDGDDVDDDVDEEDEDDDDGNGNDDDKPVNPRDRLTPEQRDRLNRMMKKLPSERQKIQQRIKEEDQRQEEEDEDKEEREAYEEFRQYIQAVKGKTLPPTS